MKEYDKETMHRIIMETIAAIGKLRGLSFLQCSSLSCEVLERRLIAVGDDERAELITYFINRLQIEITAVLEETGEPRFFVRTAVLRK